jgi:hypothetical protein
MTRQMLHDFAEPEPIPEVPLSRRMKLLLGAPKGSMVVNGKIVLPDDLARLQTGDALVEHVEQATTATGSTVSQDKPVIDAWDAAIRKVRGLPEAQAEAAPAAAAEPSAPADFGWSRAFGEVARRRDEAALELNEGAEQPNMSAADALAAALLRARSGTR